MLNAWFGLVNELGWATYQVEGAAFHPVTTDLAADVWEGPDYLQDLVTGQIGSPQLYGAPVKNAERERGDRPPAPPQAGCAYLVNLRQLTQRGTF